MALPPPSKALLTLEPLLEAVREGLEAVGWELSGLQKTTSYEFEGRWAGDASRSAYLFFHHREVPDWASIDVFLDETTRGLKGNLALVVDGRDLASLGDAGRVLSSLAALATPCLPPGHRVPLTLRYRMAALDVDPGTSETEARFKLQLPKDAMTAGHSAVSALSSVVARAFGEVLKTPGLKAFVPSEAVFGHEEDEGR